MEYYSGHFKDGEFLRPDSRFRQWIRADGSTKFAPEKGRYHLYVSTACPWSHRTLLVRSLRRLQDVIGISVTNPVWNEHGWCFDPGPGVIPDSVNGVHEIIGLYRKVDPAFAEEETVPVLWDQKLGTIVNNESRDIMRMLDHEFGALGNASVDLCPPELAQDVDTAISKMYGPVNNGVYQSGFARSQAAYERAVRRLFEALDGWDALLGAQPFVCGDRLTEADLALFVTVLRFDLVYYSHFKCNLRRMADYPNLLGWLRLLYAMPEVRETCDLEGIKRHYYGSQRDLNPSGIVPLGPDYRAELAL